MEILMNVEAINSSRDLRALRQLHDFVESHVRSLGALGADPTTYGNLLSSVLLNKLPSELQLIISRKLADDECDLTSLLKIMGEEVEARERIHSKESKPVAPPTRRLAEQHYSTATTLVSGTNPMPACCFCQQQHPSSMCTVVVEVEARKQILKKSGWCFRCLKKGHLSHECRSSVKCFNCHGHHHRSICARVASQQLKPPSSAAQPWVLGKVPTSPQSSTAVLQARPISIQM